MWAKDQPSSARVILNKGVCSILWSRYHLRLFWFFNMSCWWNSSNILRLEICCLPLVFQALHLAVMQGRLNNVRSLLTESNIDAEAFNLRYDLYAFIENRDVTEVQLEMKCNICVRLFQGSVTNACAGSVRQGKRSCHFWAVPGVHAWIPSRQTRQRGEHWYRTFTFIYLFSWLRTGGLLD